ncbi:hypothetical protein CVT25_002452 [Psilocybe cyanescens]|uniref:Uncharacterized protein n=1 Tax=Psilocybe cyanescens TaxID=93625 RepID=A0A409X6N5_PSICY|nr:hypothetical protein CVT25_002452 [Psilocybe cyanescens]
MPSKTRPQHQLTRRLTRRSLLCTGLLQHRNGSGSALDNTSSSLDYSPSVSSSSSSSYAPRARHKRPRNGPVFRKLASTPASDEPRFAPVPHHQFDPSLDTRNEVTLPPGARKMTELVGRDPLLPVLYELDQHPLVNHPCARIILGVADWSREAMAAHFRHSANTKVPRNKEDERNKYGSGRFKDDILKSWALSREDRNQDDLDKCRKLQEDILGPTSLMSPHKPVKDENGNYIGSIQFEQHDRAVNIKSGPHCYTLGATMQAQKTMSAPGAQSKVFSRTKDADSSIRFNIVKTGAVAGIMGLKKAPESLLRPVSALAPIGDDENCAWPSWQLNIAPGVSQSDSNLQASLGKFGEPHVDASDSSGIPTCMQILSKFNPNVSPEYFHILCCGIAWLMEEFSVLFFSGLHFHGGHPPITNDLYYWLTLIGYPPNQIVNGYDAVAFAAGAKHKPFIVGIEMRTPISHHLSETGICGQATWAADGGALLSPKAHINQFSRLLLQAITFFACQLPPDMIPRVDKSLAMKIVSVVIDNKRVTADDWDLGPGWTGDDVKIGTNYTQILANLNAISIEDLSPTALATLCNTDLASTAPYGNEDLRSATEEWAHYLKKSKEDIPLCVVAEGPQDESILGGHLMVGARKCAVKQALSTNQATANFIISDGESERPDMETEENTPASNQDRSL